MTCIPIPRGFVCVAPRVVEIERWLVEVHPYCGPILVGKRGDPLKNQPGPRSRFWDAFERRDRGRESVGTSAQVPTKRHTRKPLVS